MFIGLVYLLTFTMNINHMSVKCQCIQCIPFVDPMGLWVIWRQKSAPYNHSGDSLAPMENTWISEVSTGGLSSKMASSKFGCKPVKELECQPKSGGRHPFSFRGGGGFESFRVAKIEFSLYNTSKRLNYLHEVWVCGWMWSVGKKCRLPGHLFSR